MSAVAAEHGQLIRSSGGQWAIGRGLRAGAQGGLLPTHIARELRRALRRLDDQRPRASHARRHRAGYRSYTRSTWSGCCRTAAHDEALRQAQGRHPDDADYWNIHAAQGLEPAQSGRSGPGIRHRGQRGRLSRDLLLNILVGATEWSRAPRRDRVVVTPSAVHCSDRTTTRG